MDPSPVLLILHSTPRSARADAACLAVQTLIVQTLTVQTLTVQTLTVQTLTVQTLTVQTLVVQTLAVQTLRGVQGVVCLLTPCRQAP